MQEKHLTGVSILFWLHSFYQCPGASAACVNSISPCNSSLSLNQVNYLPCDLSSLIVSGKAINLPFVWLFVVGGGLL